jgi:phosphoribosylformylglycinamidine synthase
VQNALAQLGFSGVIDVRQGKYLELELSETNPQKAESEVQKMCKKLLSNMVIEDFQVEILEA